jgi:hypothetical protein
MFCAAIPVAAATGVSLNAKQLQARRNSELSEDGAEGATQTADIEKPEIKPIMQITAGVVVLLLIGSVTYHTLTVLP